MNIIVIGKNGQVSRHLGQVLGQSATLLSHADLDLNRISSIYPQLMATGADVLINAAAYTDTKRAETEQGLAYAINGAAVGEIARAAKDLQALLIHISSDYIFDGSKDSPYVENDVPNPLSVYGHSKLLGEQLIAAIAPRYWIIRTSWVFSEYRENFVKSIAALAQQQSQLDIVADQMGCPTYAGHLAKVIAEMLSHAAQRQRAGQPELSGIYHYADADCCSWYDFASAIIDTLQSGNKNPKLATLKPINSAEWPSIVQRPQNGVLDCRRIEADWGIKRFYWRDSLPQVLAGQLLAMGTRVLATKI